MFRKKTYLDYLKELEILETKDRDTFFKLKEAKEIHCEIFDKPCLFVTGRDNRCYKECKHFKKKIRPLENKSLKFLIKINNKKKKIHNKFGDLDNLEETNNNKSS